MTDPFKKPQYDFEKSMSLPHALNEHNRLTNSVPPSKSFDPKISSQDNKQAFIQAHIEANRELIKQLKNNIELLFKATGLGAF